MGGVLVDEHERVAVGREDERVVELREDAQPFARLFLKRERDRLCRGGGVVRRCRRRER